MTTRKVSESAREIADGIKGRRPSQAIPVHRVVDDLSTVEIEVAGEKQQVARTRRAADLDEARVKKTLDREEQKKRAAQLKALGEEMLASGVASREILPKIAQGIIVDLGLRLAGGEWEIKTAEEATKVAKIWYDILRLESGQATSIQEQRTGSPEDRLMRLEELKLEAKRRVEAGLRAIGDGAS
jgi:hypothetical protein